MLKQVSEKGNLIHLISLDDLDPSLLQNIINRAIEYLELEFENKSFNKILSGYTVANLFFEPSTRTRASFELAAKKLGADVINLDVNTSSRIKGENIIDTIHTLESLYVNVFIIRDAQTGISEKIAKHVGQGVSVLNAGESDTSHPTQALLDMMTIQKYKKNLSSTSVAIVGDIKHSRVARSTYKILSKFNVTDIRLIAPEELMPDNHFNSAKKYTSIEDGVINADVIMALRIQKERFKEESNIPNEKEYFKNFGVTNEILKLAKPDVILMHPGPMNRNIEIEDAVADGNNSVIREQVTNGMAIRMSILSLVFDNISNAK